MKSLIFSICLIVPSIFLSAMSTDTEASPSKRKILRRIHISVLSPDGCTIDAWGVYDTNQGLSSFRGRVTFGGGSGCYQGDLSFISTDGPLTTKPGEDIILTFSEMNSICGSSEIEWTANRIKAEEAVTILNANKSVLLQKIQEKICSN